ncbi:MAG: hypothetical protein ACPLW9_01320 [Minisyncoccales bacterium]
MIEKENKRELGKVEPQQREISPELSRVESGQRIKIDAKEYVFDQAAANEYNHWLDLIERGLLDKKESLGKIELSTSDGATKKSFSPQKIKRALENK